MGLSLTFIAIPSADYSRDRRVRHPEEGAQIRTSFLMARESTSSRAEDAAQQMLVYGIPRSVGDLIGQIDAVDSTALRQEAELILSTPVTLAAVGPLDDPAALHQLGERLRAAA